MKVIVRAKVWRASQSREARLKRMLAAARETSLYGRWLPRDGASPEKALSRVPVISLRDYDERLSRRRDVPPAPALEQDLHYPLDPAPRVAVLIEGFRSTSAVRTFVDCDLNEIAGWKVETLAAPVGVLRDLASLRRVLRYPMIAFTGLRYGAITEEDRRMFWDSFQVPVFEQFLGVHNEVLAEECEAHEGLHVRQNNVIFESLAGELVYSSLINPATPALRLATGINAGFRDDCCGCGRPGVRLENLTSRTESTPVLTAAPMLT